MNRLWAIRIALTLWAVLLWSCATAQGPLAPIIVVPALPTLPSGAKAVFAQAVMCPAGAGSVRGYDTNGNGEYDVLEIWLGSTRRVVVYYDAETEQRATHLFVQVGSTVTRYSAEAAMARFPTLCDLLTSPAGA